MDDHLEKIQDKYPPYYIPRKDLTTLKCSYILIKVVKPVCNKDFPVVFLFVSGINDCCADITSLTSGYVKGLQVVYKYLKVLPINQLLYELDRRTNERLVSR